MKTKKKKPTKKAGKKKASPNHGLNNTMANGRDRMARHRRSPACPKCGARPVVCMMRRPKFAAFRCRQCGYRWEVK